MITILYICSVQYIYSFNKSRSIPATFQGNENGLPCSEHQPNIAYKSMSGVRNRDSETLDVRQSKPCMLLLQQYNNSCRLEA